VAQDYPADRLEIIVVDDGSTDTTPEVAKRYAAEHPGRIRYIRQDNSGLAAATTRGLQEARGELITLLDADDMWVTSRTRLLVDALERNPGAGLVYGDMEVIDGDGQTVARSWLTEAQQTPFRGRVAAHLLRSNFVIAPSLMFRSRFLDRVCPIPSFFPAQDWYIAARVAEAAEIDFVPAVVARYRRHGANMSHGKDTPADIARLFRRDVGMRRWMLAHLRSSELTVEDLADAFEYLRQTLLFVARAEDVRAETVVEVTESDRERATLELAAGRSALARAEFVTAAGHFLAALAGDPFDIRARNGLDHARGRLVVPLPRAVEAPDGSSYHLKPGYTSRTVAEYVVDAPQERDGVVRHTDVYAHAADAATRLGATRIIDLGAGAGARLAALTSRFEILGVDHGPNVEIARRAFPAAIWREHDLDAAGELSLTPEQLRGAVVVCANVIEHVLRPELLLQKLRDILPSIEALVISTPDRDTSSGPDDCGPPADPSRLREWSVHEFAALLEEFAFDHGELALTGSNIVATLFPDAGRAELPAAA
jgi:SAM-dependent methyltransferase